MKPKLELAVVNTEQDIQARKEDLKLMSDPRKLKMFCGRCYHRWESTVWDSCEDPTCPRCGTPS